MEPASPDLQDLLRRVSRSFYLTLRILPRSISRQLGCAYLLARAADTITDTRLVEVGRRHEALLDLRRCIRDAGDGRKTALPDFGGPAEAQEKNAGWGTPAERLLLKNVGAVLDALTGFAPEDRCEIRTLLEIITRGQESDLIRFGAASVERIEALGADEDLDEYIYCVAGCVGEFWTRMCRARVFPKAVLDETGLLKNGVRFGKGLQLVNILRDLPADLREGRCYIPEVRLSEYGLRPRDLLEPAAISRFRPLYETYLKLAAGHLSAGWQYTATLPLRYARIRLACAWPILIGMETLARLGAANVLDGRERIKLSRSEVRRLVFKSLILYPFARAWNRLGHFSPPANIV